MAGVSFAASVANWAERTTRDIDNIHREILDDVAHRLVHGSPVDTGHFKGNWQFGIGYVPLDEIDVLDRDGVATLNKLLRLIRMAKAGGNVYFSNNVPYSLALEYGHSKQAPMGMVRITVTDAQLITDTAVAKVKGQGS